FGRWRLDRARRAGVTTFIWLQFMNEAARWDRVSLMHAGRVLVSGPPAALAEQRGVETREEAFVGYLGDAEREGDARTRPPAAAPPEAPAAPEDMEGAGAGKPRAFDRRRLLSYARRETLELLRDPIRMTLARVGR